MVNETEENAAAATGGAKEKPPGIPAAWLGKIAAFPKECAKGRAACLAAVLAFCGAVGACAGAGEESGACGAAVGSGSFEVDAPVKSLCGFAVGATPESVGHLFQAPPGGGGRDGGPSMSGKLAAPFRCFDRAVAWFREDPATGGGQYLHMVRLAVSPEAAAGRNWTEEDHAAECETIVAMLEEAHGISFRKEEWPGGWKWKWRTGKREDAVSQSIAIVRQWDEFYLDFGSDFYSARAEAALKEKRGTASGLAADAGEGRP